jgi:hypothetical protein
MSVSGKSKCKSFFFFFPAILPTEMKVVRIEKAEVFDAKLKEVMSSTTERVFVLLFGTEDSSTNQSWYDFSNLFSISSIRNYLLIYTILGIFMSKNLTFLKVS